MVASWLAMVPALVLAALAWYVVSAVYAALDPSSVYWSLAPAGVVASTFVVTWLAVLRCLSRPR